MTEVATVVDCNWKYEQQSHQMMSIPHADCVVIMATLKRPLMFDCLLLVKKFRQNLRAYTLEFPSGLVNANETAQEAAQREILELTQYIGNVRNVGEVTAFDAGLSNETVRLISLEINGGEGPNKNVRLHRNRNGENIEVVPVPIAEFQSRLLDYAHNGVIIDSRVEMYAMGLCTNSRLASTPTVI